MKLFDHAFYVSRFLVVFLVLFQSGCSLFFGNIRPVEEKSNSYGILDLSVNSSEWVKVDSTKDTPSDPAGAPQSGISDMAVQSKKTSSIISVNSACKQYEYDRKESLSALTTELLLGISEVKTFDEKNLKVDQYPALQTTISGKINHEHVMLRTVVLQRKNCVYDLMYVSRPEKFEINEADFSRFVSSLRLK